MNLVTGRKVVWLERVAIAVASLVVAIVLIALVSGYFTGRDQGALSSSDSGTEVGLTFVDQGNEQLAPGSKVPTYDSDPPTSGPHVPVAVTADNSVLSNDQILQALSVGDVVILYGSAQPPSDLVTFADSAAGPFSASLAAAGQAVILGRRPGTRGIIALAWTRMLRQSSPDLALLEEFVQAWLGRGASATG